MSVCVALDRNSRLWYVITLKLANLPTTYVLHISSANVRLEPRAKTVRFFGPIAVSRRNGLQFNELFESCRLPKRGQVVHIFREENSFKKPASRSIERPKKRVPLYLGDRSQQIMSVVRHSKEALRSKTIMYKKETTTK